MSDQPLSPSGALPIPNEQMAPPTTQIIELPKTIYINFFDGINEPKVKAFMGIISDIIARQKPKGLYFLFSSPGGSVNAGIVFYNFLRALPVEITMHNTGSVDSIGTVIFLAGSKRYAASNSSFLFHGVLQMFQASQALSHVQMVERLSILKEDENKIAGIVAARTHLTEKEVRELFHQGETKNAAFAKERGIIDDVVDPAIPSGAPFVTVNLN